MSRDLIQVLSDLRPIEATRVDEAFPRAWRSQTLRAIVTDAQPAQCAAARRRLPVPERTRSAGRLGRIRAPLLVTTLGAMAAAAVAATLLAMSSAVGPQSASGAVVFRTAAGGDVVATVTDPFAARSRLETAFVRRGFRITLTLIPVSPSAVGTVVYTSDDGGRSRIEPLQGGRCLTGGGGCPIGIRIPASFTGRGYITLGRPAHPGEAYQSTASAFAPGEILHCSGLLGARVGVALPVLRGHGLTVDWRESTTQSTAGGGSTSRSRTDPSPPLNNYIWSADTIASGRVMVWTEPTPWPGTASTGAQFDAGC